MATVGIEPDSFWVLGQQFGEFHILQIQHMTQGPQPTSQKTVLVRTRTTVSTPKDWVFVACLLTDTVINYFFFWGYQRLGICLFATVSRPALGPTQPPYPMGTWSPFPEGKAAGAWSWTHFHVVPRSRMRGAIRLFPQYVFIAWSQLKHRDNFTLPLCVCLNALECCVSCYLFQFS
jgi:hypothetical protein